MEKLVWIGLLLLSVWLVPAADLVTDAGKKYENVEMCHLSMGMSGDYREAIMEGATIVRVGSALFN